VLLQAAWLLGQQTLGWLAVQVCAHSPLEQAWPTGQTLPQPPQLTASLLSFAQ
jgi:hypothetical protein